MEAAAHLLLRSATRTRGCSARTALKQQQRNKATATRTRRALNIAPHPDFLARDGRLMQDRIIFNPPAAVPSVYHTPFKFLPKTDPRRRANLVSLFESHFAASSSTRYSSSASASGTPGSVTDLPTVRSSDHHRKTHNSIDYSRPPITRAEVDEMRLLRDEDPHRWSCSALAEKYNVPRIFVATCCRSHREKAEFERRKLELIRARWGPIRAKARDARRRRKEMLYKGEL